MTSSRSSLTIVALVAAALAICAETAAQARSSKGARSGIPPFCVLIIGPRGFALPQICEFFDYRQCLQAAADMRGNCVVNIDYPDKITSAPGANWSQPAR